MVDEATYTAWKSRLSDATNASLSNDRQDNINSIMGEIESDLTLIGVTGIEDRLQDGVEDTIAVLLAAGIRIWMLTGDKPETAVNIAKSCGLLRADARILRLYTPDISAIRKVIAKGMQLLVWKHSGSSPSGSSGSNTSVNETSQMEASREATVETSDGTLVTNGETLARIWTDDQLTSQLEQVN